MRSPAFQFYADDFLAGVADMTQAEVGAYILLLCHQWSTGAVPSDLQRSALIAKGEVSTHVSAKFPDGKNVRLEAERAKQAEWRAKCSNGGHKSAETRKGSSTTLQLTYEGKGQVKGNTPSPSPSPIKRHRAVATAPTSDSAWLAELGGNQAYAGISVPTEFAKMQAWCSANRKEPTRRRFINWLNRAEKPMRPTAAYRAPVNEGPPNWRETLRRLYPDNTCEGAFSTLAESVQKEILTNYP